MLFQAVYDRWGCRHDGRPIGIPKRLERADWKPGTDDAVQSEGSDGTSGNNGHAGLFRAVGVGSVVSREA
jgi:hypothetical protein